MTRRGWLTAREGAWRALHVALMLCARLLGRTTPAIWSDLWFRVLLHARAARRRADALASLRRFRALLDLIPDADGAGPVALRPVELRAAGVGVGGGCVGARDDPLPDGFDLARGRRMSEQEGRVR